MLAHLTLTCAHRLGLSLPETALVILQQEARFKRDQDELRMFLDGFNALEASIPQKVKPLLVQHLADLDRKLRLHVLTCSS